MLMGSHRVERRGDMPRYKKDKKIGIGDAIDIEEYFNFGSCKF